MLMSKLGIDGSKIGSDMLDSVYADAFDLSQQKFTLSDTPNQLENFYIDPSIQIPEYSTEFAIAYQAFINKGAEGENAEAADGYYALAFKKMLPIRLKEIIALKSHAVNNIFIPITYGLVNVGISSEERFFVVIMPKPKGKNIAELVRSGVKLDEVFIVKRVLKPLLNTLNHIHQISIVHGKINADNIFIDADGAVTLGECISESCGFSQPPFFETTERAQAQAYGKGYATEKVDYYALGCTLYTLLTGKNFSTYDPKELVRAKLQAGTFSFMSQSNHNISSKLLDLIKGLVIDDPQQRWTYIDIDAFIQGRNYNKETVVDKSIMARAITFNSRDFYSMRALAHEMAQNWDAAKELLKTDKIKKWFESNQCDQKFMEMFFNFGNHCASSKIHAQKIFSADDEKLIKILILLDPIAPIRIRNVAFHKDGLGLIMLSAFNNGQSDITQLLAGTLFCNIFNIYEFLASQLGDVSYMQHMILLNKCSEYIRRNEIGFGFERCIYELNTVLPCQAAPMKSDFCISLKDMLNYIEENAMPFDAIISKKAIPAFIGAKVGLANESKAYELEIAPALQKSRAIQLTLIFAAAQKQSKIGKLEHIASIMKTALIDVIDNFLRSRAIKKEIANNLAVASKTGDLYDVYKAVANTVLIKKDMDGYVNAIKRGAEIARDIFLYNNQALMVHDIRRKSLKVAVKFSYIISFFIIVVLLLEGS